MNRSQHTPGREPPWETSVSEHYAALTDQILEFGGDLLASHFGLWGPDTMNDREALRRANHTLIEGCDLGPGRRVLDAGCGVGGTAITLAEKYGVHVTGLTICEPHVAVAAEHAERRGVSHLVEFRYGDFMDLPFPDGSFSAVLNHESFCYAPDKLAYLRGVLRVLKPGGRWQALEGLRSGAPFSARQETIHETAQRGWRMPPLERWRDVLSTLEEAGFENTAGRDLSAEVAPAIKKLRDRGLMFTLLMDQPMSRAAQELLEATVAYDEGLRAGLFTYHFLSGARPEPPDDAGSFARRA